jgi:hypothetical protein
VCHEIRKEVSQKNINLIYNLKLSWWQNSKIFHVLTATTASQKKFNKIGSVYLLSIHV